MEKYPTVELKDFVIYNGQDRILTIDHFIWQCSASIGIVGVSGGGKSIFAKALLGLLPPFFRAEGSMWFHVNENESVDLLSLQEEQRIRFNRGKFSFIFQEPQSSFNPVMKCGVQLREVVKNPDKTSKEQILEILQSVKLADPLRAYESFPHQLSGGQLQRIMLAMSLLTNPAFVVADEPTTALDKITQSHIIELLSDLQSQHKWGLLLISHDGRLVSQLTDEIWMIKNRKLSHLHHETGKTSKDLPLPNNSISTERKIQNLSIQNLGVSYKRNKWFGKPERTLALQDFNLELKTGMITGLVGESGCGKSTVAKIIARMITPDTGSISFQNIPMEEYSRKSWSSVVQMLFQDAFSSLNPRITIGTALKEVLDVQEGVDEKVANILDELNLPKDTINKYPHAFSGGQRQRIAIARALLKNPHFLIVDESIAGLDFDQQRQVVDLLSRISIQRNMGVLFISHDLYWVVKIAQEVVVLKKGKIIEKAEVSQIINNPVEEYTRTLLQASFIIQ